MKHRKRIIKLGRMSSHRKAMLQNMASSLLLYSKIHTTLPKAKAVVHLVDKLITWAKKGSLHYRRLAFSVLKNHLLVKKLFSEIAPSMANHSGGYTRIIKAGTRLGDGSPMAILELVGKENIEEKKETKKKAKVKKEKTKEEK